MRLILVLQIATGLEIAAAPGQDPRDVLVGVVVADAELVAPEHHGAVEHRAAADVLRIREFVENVGDLRRVPRVDLDELVGFVFAASALIGGLSLLKVMSGSTAWMRKLVMVAFGKEGKLPGLGVGTGVKVLVGGF